MLLIYSNTDLSNLLYFYVFVRNGKVPPKACTYDMQIETSLGNQCCDKVGREARQHIV